MRAGRIAFNAVAGTAFAIAVAPLALVVWLSFVSNEILVLPPEGYSLRWYGAMLGQPQFLQGFRLSLLVALVAAAAGLLVSVPAAFAIVRGRFPGRQAVLQLLTAPLAVPAIALGAAVYVAFVETEVQTGLELNGATLGLGAAHTLLTIPWCLRLLVANLQGLDRSVEEAAWSLGAPPAATTWLVTLPLIRPGLVAAALFSFVVSFGNLEVSLFLVAPGQTTLPIAVLQYLQWKVDPVIAAVSTVQIAVVAAGLLLTSRFVPLAKVIT